MNSGAQIGSLFRVYVDGREIRGADGKSLGREMNDIAVIRITRLQPEFCNASLADKKAGNLALIRRGDKIFPVTEEEMQEMIKNKVFPKSRPKEVQLDDDLQNFLKGAK